MKGNRIVALMAIGCAVLLHGCASTRPTKMFAVVSSDQKIGFEDTIISQKKHLVSLAPYTELDVAKDKTMFILGIQSGGDTPFDIGYDSVSVRFQDSGTTQRQSSVSVQTYEEFMGELREEQRRSENRYIRDALENVIYKLQAVSSRSSSSSDDSVSSGSSSAFASDDSSSSGSDDFDSARYEVEVLLDDLELDIESMRINNQLLRDALPDIIMKPGTVMPGGAYSGIVVCDTRKLDESMEGRFQVAVLVDGEQHLFTFDRQLN